MKLGGMALPVLAATLVSSACAKTPVAAAPAPTAPGATPVALPIPELGSKAPDFKFTPVTTAGIGKPTKLSALKGQTTVVWFFFKARTRG